MTNTAPSDLLAHLQEDAALAQHLAAECARLDVPGCAVGILLGDRAIAATYGVTNVRAPLPVDADTLFPIFGGTSPTTVDHARRCIPLCSRICSDGPAATRTVFRCIPLN